MFRAGLPALLACATIACLDAREVETSVDLNRSEVLCGLPVVESPATRPLDPCIDGAPLLWNRFHRNRGKPHEERVAFTVAADVAACVTLETGGCDRHREASGWVKLDGERLAGPGLFDRGRGAAEHRVTLAAGEHVISAKLVGKPGSWVEVSVLGGGSAVRHAPVSSHHLELHDLYADPPSFVPEGGPARLTASGSARDLRPPDGHGHHARAGGPSGPRYVVRWRFELLAPGSCATVRTLRGESALGPSLEFAPEARWDGRDDGGELVPAGSYAYRLVAELLRRSRPRDELLDTLATALQRVTLVRTAGGYVDFHTHPLSHLGFGEKALHGAPDLDQIIPAGNLSCNGSPLRATTPAQALGSCNGTHGGWGLFDNTCGDHLRAAVINLAIDSAFAFRTSNLHGDHQHEGWPGLPYWPHQTSKLHQQMWWEWLKRAHEGGLGAIVALTVNNELLAEIINGNRPFDDRSVAERQIAETVRMVGRHDWMEIAYSSADLARIQGEGKLAVVLGMEIDRIGNWNVLSLPSEEAIRAELRHLHALGVRYVFPVHLVDNVFGGAAVYSPLFSFANRRANGYHFLVGTSPDPNVTFDLGRIEDLPISPGIGNASLAALHGLLLGLGELPAPCIDDISCLPPPGKLRCCGSFGEITDILRPSPELDVYGFISPGHVNLRGLSSRGEIAVDELMKLGMFIDLDHMSERTMERVVSLAEQAGERTGVAYPLMLGHSGIRGPDSSERMPPLRLVERVSALGGMLGAGSADTTPERFAADYRRLAAVMGPSSVGIGTDANGFERLPRSSEACVLGADSAGSAAFYARFDVESGLTGRSTNGPGGRTWDYVLDCGVSHYGLMPEFLFDVRAFHGGEDVYDGLMRSSAGFLRMWRQLEEASARLQ